MTQLDDRSAVYQEPQAERVTPEALALSLRVAYLEGEMSVALEAIRELRIKLEEREGDHK